MKPSEKQQDLFSHAFTAQCAMRDIDNENPGERVAGDTAWFELEMTMQGTNALTLEEVEALAPVIEAWRKLADRGNDDEDGQDFAAWNDEIAPLIAALATYTYVESYLADADTIGIEF
jgi:hypothetical protein